ncbi:MAG TPA: hypothetical protein PK514_15585 [Spirochaetota bacterium]|nr:hypothetical protein [Spirochaetota bacterium]
MTLKIDNLKPGIIIFCMALVLMLPATPVFPGEQGSGGQNKLVFTPVLVKSDVTGIFMDDVSAIIKKNLQGDDYFFINDKFTPDERITFNNYITGRCVTELAKVIPGGIIILVAVKKGDVKVGEKQHSRYVVEEIIETRYTIYVSTVDLSAGRYDLKFRETVNDAAKLSDEADNIGKKIREFYTRRKSEVKTDAVKGDSPLINIISMKQGVSLCCINSHDRGINSRYQPGSFNPVIRINTK